MLDLLAATGRSLAAHKLRFALTSLGVGWGVLVLTFLAGYTDGFDRHFQAQMTKIGPRVVYLFPGVVMKDRVGERGARLVELELEDVDRLRALDVVDRASPNTWLGPRVARAGRRTKLLYTYGVTPDAGDIRSFDVAAGRFLSDADVERAARVVYLGPSAARRMFGEERAVGRELSLDSIRFRVVGVGREKGEQMVNVGPRDDELALIPISTAQRWFTHTEIVGQVVLAPRTREQAGGAIGLARGLLGVHHEFDADSETALGSFNIQEALSLVQQLGLAIRVFLTGTSLVTVAVGAIGVMNIMLVVVNERRSEIGLRKAVGASRRAIFAQFLAEALAVTLLAGLLGLGLGWLAIELSALSLPESSMQPRPVFEWRSAALVCVALVSAGVAAGTLPALRASRVDPAIALRWR